MAPSASTGANKRRRTSANTNTTSTSTNANTTSQSTISFTNPTKPSAGKPASRASKTAEKPSSKPLAPQTAKSATADIALPSRPSQAEISGAVSATPEVVEEAEAQAEAEYDSEDEREAQDEAAAAKISDKQIKVYWTGKEDARKAPRVHQAGLSVRERVCREFDMELRFGVCVPLSPLRSLPDCLAWRCCLMPALSVVLTQDPAMHRDTAS